MCGDIGYTIDVSVRSIVAVGRTATGKPISPRLMKYDRLANPIAPWSRTLPTASSGPYSIGGRVSGKDTALVTMQHGYGVMLYLAAGVSDGGNCQRDHQQRHHNRSEQEDRLRTAGAHHLPADAQQGA